MPHQGVKFTVRVKLPVATWLNPSLISQSLPYLSMINAIGKQ